MKKAEDIENEARALLAPFGLSPLGWFDADGKPALLVGNIGSSLWPAFSGSDEFHDGEMHSMDRWTARVTSPLAKAMSAEIMFPFGEKVWPFQDYAKRATGIQQSPIGLLIHPEHGLWMAFRCVLVFEEVFEFESPTVDPHPCDSCLDKPCLNTCPIGAFTPSGYDYMSCKTHVREAVGNVCKLGGCLARQACPIGQNYRYEPDHIAFHMAAYV